MQSLVDSMKAHQIMYNAIQNQIEKQLMWGTTTSSGVGVWEQLNSSSTNYKTAYSTLTLEGIEKTYSEYEFRKVKKKPTRRKKKKKNGKII